MGKCHVLMYIYHPETRPTSVRALSAGRGQQHRGDHDGIPRVQARHGAVPVLRYKVGKIQRGQKCAHPARAQRRLHGTRVPARRAIR